MLGQSKDVIYTPPKMLCRSYVFENPIGKGATYRYVFRQKLLKLCRTPRYEASCTHIPLPKICVLLKRMDSVVCRNDHKRLTKLLGKSELGIRLYGRLRGAGFSPVQAGSFLWPKYVGSYQSIGERSLRISKVYHLENHPVVKPYVQRLRQELEITKEDVLAGMMDCVYSAGNATELLLAWREIGRIIGAYAPSIVKLERPDPAEPGYLDRISMLSESELMRLIAAADSRLEKNVTPLIQRVD